MSKVLSYEEYLEENGELTYTNVGISMMPLLRQGKDLFTVTRKDPTIRCKIGDVVLYKRPPDQFVLHRVIRVRPHDYVILGDNCVGREYGIRDEDILGVMTGFTRGKTAHSVNETGYRLYSFLILHTIPFRIFWKKLKAKAASFLKRKKESNCQ